MVVGGGSGRELMKLDARCAPNSARPFVVARLYNILSF